MTSLERCSFLGPREEWDRFAPLAAPTVVVEGFEHFSAAVIAAARGDLPGARAALARVENEALRSWYIERARWAGDCRAERLGMRKLPKYEGKRDKRKNVPASMAAGVYDRDGFRCRYCHRPVVSRRLTKLLHGLLGTDFPLGTDRSTHGAAHCFGAVADHVLPHSRGGLTDLANLVTACNPCNYGKYNYTLEQLGLKSPWSREAPRGWTPLDRLIPDLAAQVRARLGPGPRV